MNRRRFLRDTALLAGATGALDWTGITTAWAAQPGPRRHAATHYASPAGAGAHNGSRGNEWTLAEAYANAVAGNRVQFAPGTYVVQSGPNRTAAFTPKNSGTAGNPIIFFAEFPAVYHQQEPQRHTTWVSDFKVHGLGSVTGHADRAQGGRYVAWDGISLRQVNGAWNSGEMGVVSLFAGGALHVKFLRCLFDQQGQGQLDPQNNWGAVFIQQSTGIEFADCVFQNIPGSRGDENAMPIVTYAAGELEIHHCEFRNNSGGSAFLKGVQAGSSHDNRPARLHHCLHTGYSSLSISFGAVGQGNLQEGRTCDVFQNIFHPASNGLGLSIWWRDVSGGQAPRNIRMVNNTLVGPIPFEGGEEALHRLMTITDGDDIWRDTLFMNNIVQHEGGNVSYIGVQYGQNTTAAFRKMRSDYNCFASGFRGYAGMDLGDWKKIGQDTHSLFGNPRLRDRKGGDFRLEANSPVRATGSQPGLDVLNLQGSGPTAPINMGAYITADMTDVIGIRPEAATSALPLVWTWPYA
jgi:hypothetical protein